MSHSSHSSWHLPTDLQSVGSVGRLPRLWETSLGRATRWIQKEGIRQNFLYSPSWLSHVTFLKLEVQETQAVTILHFSIQAIHPIYLTCLQPHTKRDSDRTYSIGLALSLLLTNPALHSYSPPSKGCTRLANWKERNRKYLR